MSKRRRKPGRLWWLGTFATGICSPAKGQRRVDNAMREKDEYIAELEEEIRKLKVVIEGIGTDRKEVAEENHVLRANLEMADGVAELHKVKIAADKAAATVPLRVPAHWAVTDPGVINGRPHGRAKTTPIDRHK